MEKNAEAEKAGIENEAADTKNTFNYANAVRKLSTTVGSRLKGNYEEVKLWLLLGGIVFTFLT